MNFFAHENQCFSLLLCHEELRSCISEVCAKAPVLNTRNVQIFTQESAHGHSKIFSLHVSYGFIFLFIYIYKKETEGQAGMKESLLE